MAKKKPAQVHESSHERAIWRGSISFGLVQIPVGLYRAESTTELHFTMLDKRDHAPVRFERKNGQTGKPIAWNDIVKGYEYRKGDYIIMTDEDFAAANVKATGGIDIIDFVDAKEVDPLYYSKPYYLLPQDKGEKTYVLLRESLRRADKVGVGKIVIRTRQHLALVRVYGDALVLELLRFPHELRPVQELRFPPRAPKIAGLGSREMAMAASLIDSMSGHWDPGSYSDDYHDDLVALIRKKERSGAKATPAPAPRAAKNEGSIIDIMTLLQRSVAAKKPQPAKGSKARNKASAAPKAAAAKGAPRKRAAAAVGKKIAKKGKAAKAPAKPRPASSKNGAAPGRRKPRSAAGRG